MRRLPLPAVLGAALLLVPAGCAKGPSGSTSSASDKQLVITMNVRGQIDLADDYYYVVFNVNGLTRNGFVGPVPVVTDFERGGNGFAGGAFTTFVECHQGEPQGSNIGIYSTDTTLLQRNYLGSPVQQSVSGSTISFQIPLSEIAQATSAATGTTIMASEITSLEINVITTNVVPTNPQDTTVKYFDALGDPRLGELNAYITLPTSEDTTYTNDTLSGQEPADDVATYTTSTSTTQTDFSGTVQVVPDQSPAALSALDLADASGQPAWTVEFRG